jgi:hypothetical protein
MVKIPDHYIPTDFMVLDMGEEEIDPPIVLERLFLDTTRAIIYMRSGEIHFQFYAEKVRCYFNSYTNYEQPKKNRRRCQSTRRQGNKPTKDGWTNYSRKVERYEDCQNEKDNKVEKGDKPQQPASTLSLPTKQIWKKKGSPSSSQSPQEEQPSRSPSPGSEEASQN